MQPPKGRFVLLGGPGGGRGGMPALPLGVLNPRGAPATEAPASEGRASEGPLVDTGPSMNCPMILNGHSQPGIVENCIFPRGIF